MRIQTFWNRPIVMDNGGAAWQEGGRSAMELAFLVTLVTYVAFAPISTPNYMIGLVSFLFTAMCAAYLVGGIAALVLRGILRRLWRRVGYVGCILLGVGITTLASWQFLSAVSSSFDIMDALNANQDMLSLAIFYVLANVAFIVMGGRGAAKLYELWSNSSPSHRRC